MSLARKLACQMYLIICDGTVEMQRNAVSELELLLAGPGKPQPVTQPVSENSSVIQQQPETQPETTRRRGRPPRSEGQQKEKSRDDSSDVLVPDNRIVAQDATPQEVLKVVENLIDDGKGNETIEVNGEISTVTQAAANAAQAIDLEEINKNSKEITVILDADRKPMNPETVLHMGNGIVITKDGMTQTQQVEQESPVEPPVIESIFEEHPLPTVETFDKDAIEHKKMLVAYLKTKGYTFTDDSGKAFGKRVAEAIYGCELTAMNKTVDAFIATLSAQKGSEDVLF